MVDRDASIIAQNAGSTAASLLATMAAQGVQFDVLDMFTAVREQVFEGTYWLADRAAVVTQANATPPVQQAEQAQAVQAVVHQFPGATTGPAFTIVSKDRYNAEDPAWLTKEFAYQQSKGKIAADDCELFDNRGRLPQYGGDGNPKAPWYRTTKGKVGLWPPK